jgi:hypothetical protein
MAGQARSPPSRGPRWWSVSTIQEVLLVTDVHSFE